MIERHPIASNAHGCYVTSMSKKENVGLSFVIFNSFIAKQWMSFCGEGENGVSRR